MEHSKQGNSQKGT